MTTCTLDKMKYQRLSLFFFVRGLTVISRLAGLGAEDQQNGLNVISFCRLSK
jgi:hypothetical protein